MSPDDRRWGVVRRGDEGFANVCLVEIWVRPTATRNRLRLRP